MLRPGGHHTFGDIEVACKVQRLAQAGGGEGQMVQLLRRLFRMNELDVFARDAIARRQRGIDEIEILPAYRVGLKAEGSAARIYPANSRAWQRPDSASA